jgi:ribosomal protein S18 acetylase RimI-like enzyme
MAYLAEFPKADPQIVSLGGIPIGRLLINRGEKEIRLVDISILPQCRNTGIGSLLVRRVQKEAAALRLPVVLHVLRSNPALRLYERLGFLKLGDNGPYVRMKWSSGG